MHHSARPGVIRCATLLAGLTLAAQADELAEKGREIFKQNQRAVVTVQVVVKMKVSLPGMGGQANESKEDVTGTIVDPSGLTVLALSSCEPGEMIQSMMAGISDEDVKFKIETELSNIKLLLDDGTTLPANTIIREQDPTLTFWRPVTKPAGQMTALDLNKSATAQVLDQVITLNRLGKAAGRAYAASVERISAVVQKPRLFYIPGSEMTSTALGSPAFSLDGNVLGVFVMRSVSQKGGGVGMFNFRPQGLTTIILPAADILKAAKQAPENKVAEDKKEEVKPLKEAK